MNNFKKNKFTVVKKAIDPLVADFVKEYLISKAKVARTLFDHNYVSPYASIHGTFNDPQVPGAFSIYGDVANEVLLERVKPIMQETTKLDLVETYAYARVYKKCDELRRHKDRASCEISTTMNLGGDEWPIYIESDPKKGKFDKKTNLYSPSKSKGNKVILSPGDMLIYRGCDLEHWREPFQGEICVQVFLHYNIAKDSAKTYDGRIHLGLPFDLKR